MGSNACARHDNACARVIIPFHAMGGSAARWHGRRLFKLLPQSGGQFQHQLFATAGGIVVDAPEDDAQVVPQVLVLTRHQLAVNAGGHARLLAEAPYGGDAFGLMFALFHSHTATELLHPNTQFRVFFFFVFIRKTVKMVNTI